MHAGTIINPCQYKGPSRHFIDKKARDICFLALLDNNHIF